MDQGLNLINKNTILWLKNGLWALALAGVYSIILVVLRTPGVSGLFKDKSLFKSSLIVHVDLSVLAWLLSVTAFVWSYKSRDIFFEKMLNKLSFVGMILMAASPIIGSSNPVMNNYVPILENVWFIIGLSLFGTSLLCFAILVFVINVQDFCFKCKDYLDDTGAPLSIVKVTSSLMYIGVWVCFVLSQKQLIYIADFIPMDIEYYYELLFWSGGHLMQFIYTQIVMFVWLFLFQSWKKTEVNYDTIYSALFILNFLISILIFYGHLSYQMPDYEYISFFTDHMKYGGGLAPALFILFLLGECLSCNSNEITGFSHKFISTSFFASILLFFFGGLIGILISGVNVSIPAHYHGAIVGISIAFLGFAYIFCFKNAAHQESKWANIQLCVITFGQLIHISGLALSGGYGILRKNPDDVIPISAKFYMAMMGSGGLIAIIGGLMFVFICGKRLYSVNDLQNKIK